MSPDTLITLSLVVLVLPLAGFALMMFFGKKLPASTLVAVAALAHPDWLIEVEAIAVL